MEFLANHALGELVENHLCLPAPPRPNTTPKFHLVDVTKPPLSNSPCPFLIDAWARLLQGYPGPLPIHLIRIMRFGVQIGYEGPEILMISKNLTSANEAPEIIAGK